MTAPLPRLAPLGDGAFTIEYGSSLTEPARRAAAAAARILADAPIPGLVEVVPGYVAVTVHYDPAAGAAPVRDAILLRLAGEAAAHLADPGRLVTIPVRYDGPDLEAVARATGLTSDQVAERHQAVEYRVGLLGFVPGFAYLGPLDPALVLPRRATPRQRVPPGSVAIAGEQTGIYPAATPGGWHLIGRTRIAMFDPGRSPPCHLAVGDRVRFVAER